MIYKYGQHDSIEFMRILLNDIHKENNINDTPIPYQELDDTNKTKQQLSEEYHNYFLNRENSFIVDLFYIQQINTFICKCGYNTYSFEKYLDIPLLIPNNRDENNIYDLLKEYIKIFKIKWEKPCINCKKSCEHSKIIKFNKLGDIIIISIQRINKFLNKKNECIIHFSEDLNMKEFCDETINTNDLNFKLFGIINHIGSIEYGHYFSTIKIDSNWYEFNDSVVRKIPKLDPCNKSVCVLFYTKSL